MVHHDGARGERFPTSEVGRPGKSERTTRTLVFLWLAMTRPLSTVWKWCGLLSSDDVEKLIGEYRLACSFFRRQPQPKRRPLAPLRSGCKFSDQTRIDPFSEVDSSGIGRFVP